MGNKCILFKWGKFFKYRITGLFSSLRNLIINLIGDYHGIIFLCLV